MDLTSQRGPAGLQKTGRWRQGTTGKVAGQWVGLPPPKTFLQCCQKFWWLQDRKQPTKHGISMSQGIRWQGVHLGLGSGPGSAIKYKVSRKVDQATPCRDLIGRNG